MYWVYAISSETRNYIYVGITDNPDRRIAQHNARYSKTTKPYRPFVKIMVEEHASRIEAREREKYLIRLKALQCATKWLIDTIELITSIFLKSF